MLTTLNTQRQLPKVGEKARLYTHLHVREDALDLFGFATLSEMHCFQMLTGVSGVGPKVGLGILSELSSEQVAMSVAAGDSKTLTRAPGVGPKLAQRIVLELADKVKKMASRDDGGFVPAEGRGGFRFVPRGGSGQGTVGARVRPGRRGRRGGKARQFLTGRRADPAVAQGDGKPPVSM